MTETELAARGGTTAAQVARLAGLGLLSSREPPFASGDVFRVRLVESFEQAGVSADDVGHAVASGHVSLSFVDAFHAEGAELADRTYRDVCAELGVSTEVIERLHMGLGLPRPQPDDRPRKDELEHMPFLVRGLAMIGDEREATRASVTWGEALRRLAAAQNATFERMVMQPLLDSGMSEQQVIEMASRLGLEMQPAAEQMMVWLYRQHLERYVLQSLLEHLQSAMDAAGLIAGRSRGTPAIAFLDLAGFTPLTEELGDEAAAEVGMDLAELVQRSASSYGGTLVKLLGDGVMFHFREPANAVRCALDLVEQVPKAGLPPAHVGMDAGPVVLREGDYFGRTVNVAARIAGRARPGEVLVSDAVVAAGVPAGVTFEEMGPVELKGLAQPVSLHRAVRA